MKGGGHPRQAAGPPCPAQCRQTPLSLPMLRRTTKSRCEWPSMGSGSRQASGPLSKSPDTEPVPHLTAGCWQRQKGGPKLPPNPSTPLQDRHGREARLVWGPGCSGEPCQADLPPPAATLDPVAIPSALPPLAGGPGLTVLPLCWGAVLAGWGVGSIPHRAFVSLQRDRLSSWSCPQQGPAASLSPSPR